MLGVHVVAPLGTLPGKEGLGRAIVVRNLNTEHSTQSLSHRIFQNLRSREDFAKRTEASASGFENPCEPLQVHRISVKVERIEFPQPVRLLLKVGRVRKESGAQKARAATELGVGRIHRYVHDPGAAPKRTPAVLKEIAGAGRKASGLVPIVEVTNDRHRGRSRRTREEKPRPRWIQ